MTLTASARRLGAFSTPWMKRSVWGSQVLKENDSLENQSKQFVDAGCFYVNEISKILVRIN